MAAPAVDTWEGVLEAGGWVMAAVVEGAGVVAEPEEAAPDEAGTEDGASLRGEVAVDSTDEAGGAGGATAPDEAGGAGGASPDETEGAGGTSTDETAGGGE